MRKLMTAALALAGLSSSALADDPSVEALVGLTFPVTVAPAGNTPEYLIEKHNPQPVGIQE